MLGYQHDFAEDGYNEDKGGTWARLQREFAMDAAEPEEVLLADYTYENYSGEAVVVFRNGDSYSVVTGSHCSCYGLEGQWEPETYDKATFVAVLERAQGDRWDNFMGHASELAAAIG